MRWAAIKSLRALVTMWLVVTFVFFVLRISGDPTTVLLPDDVDETTRAFYRAKWGLDAPLWSQYVDYFRALLQGDFGISFRNNQDAFQLVWDRVPKTALLGGTALTLALVIGTPLGVLAALYRDSWLDRAIMSVAVFGFSMPNFFLGILLILIFSLHLRLLPSSGSGTVWHLVMPALTLGTGFAAQIARYTRSSMIDVLSKPYMRTARSKGAGPARRVTWHAVPNAAVPVVTILGFKVGELLGWAVVTETVFAWPGIGRLLTNAVAARDLAVVQCIMILLAFTMVSANMLVDLVYGWLDPRVRVGAGTRQR
ncbi:Dipeptide transport system permease protein DppB [Rhodovulum sp. P5]|uniref:ABC transporter permease n=1 Tax=Rhodovulum sp. P5 TaxID=1564506 RepID=UPI0009C20E83|nr:ABC transporter permease [Rhodovulum sp. P5]ARE39033.1 Dipeptide transport system permease protein DppB [Rhodovulum sp. P5]